MDFEQDYVMRMIKQMMAALICVVLGKDNKIYDLSLEDQYKSSDGLLRELITMVYDGKINETETCCMRVLSKIIRKTLKMQFFFTRI